MFKQILKYLVFVALFAFVISCTDDDEGIEFLYNREVSEVTVLMECPPGVEEGTACYQIRYRYPVDADEDFVGVRLWLDTTVVDDTSKAVTSKQIEKGILYKYTHVKGRDFDTIDLTELVADYVKIKRDSLQVALYCEYDDNDDDGAVYRFFMQFGDHQPPSEVSLQGDSTWATGAKFEWYRPTDQTSFYSFSELSGEIFGYNIRLYALDPDEDISDLQIAVYTPEGKDVTGGKYYFRQAAIRSDSRLDSIWIDDVKNNSKRMLNIVVPDGKGFDMENNENNLFRIFITGLRTRTPSTIPSYTISISAWDVAGNSVGFTTSPDMGTQFSTTDSVAPVMPKKIYTIEDTLFPGFARLDSNNRLVIFWERGVDPLDINHEIESDSILIIPSDCKAGTCYEVIDNYIIDRYNKLAKTWEPYVTDRDNKNGRFKNRFKWSDDEMVAASDGNFVSDTIRWTAPGDTLILRIRAKDNSGYLSAALIDTVIVSKGPLAKKVDCPAGYVAVSTSDSNYFCMEKFEHRDRNGKFVTGVLHSEAVFACEAVDAKGFDVGLCKERDWELVCLSGNALAYGVVEDGEADSTSGGSDPSVYLTRQCNVSTEDSLMAADLSKRDYRCVNPDGVRDMPGQYQEWALGRSEDTVAVLKGSSFRAFSGLEKTSIAYCTNRAFPYYVRLEYVTDTVYLYREGTKVDTVYEADTSRTLYAKLSQSDFTDSLQFYDVMNSVNEKIGEDYSLYSEYKKGGAAWLDSLSKGLTYKPSRVEAVFLTGKKVNYRQAAAFYRSSSIGFRCCAYPKK